MHSSTLHQRGILLVLSSPSGAGKTTISKLLLKSVLGIKLSLSVTTRAPRPAEEHNKDYIFVSQEQFSQMVEKDLFLEYAKVFGNYYGTPKQFVEEALIQGEDVLFDIDWQGTQQLKQKMDSDVVSIFILPPSLEELERRLYKRAQDDEYVILDRMSRAIQEVSHWPEYDYVLVNHGLEVILHEIKAIIKAEKLKKHRQIGLENFVRDLTE